MKTEITRYCFAFLLVLTLINMAYATSNLNVISFSCPSEVTVGNQFQCSATIQNTGDTSVSVTDSKLNSDEKNWFGSSVSGGSLSVAQSSSASLTFNLNPTSSGGSNGFTNIMLDNVAKECTGCNYDSINVINVVPVITNSVSSAAMGQDFDSTVEVTAGGNIDVTLTLSVNSGGCSIGSQSSQKNISDMQEGYKQSRTWTITQGTSGSCVYTISALANGINGVASKTVSSSSSVRCTDCPTSSTESGTGGSGGGAGGGGAGGNIFSLGELTGIQTKDLGNGDKIKFNISSTEHTLTLIGLGETNATITIESEKQTFTLLIGDEKNVDLNADNIADISIKLKSINILTKKATFIISQLTGSTNPDNSDTGKEEKTNKPGENFLADKLGQNTIILLIIGIIILAIVIYFLIKKYRDKRLYLGHK